MTTPSVALAAGTKMERFEINSILGMGGFGITYKAWDHRLQRQVAVKEYLPGELAIRGEDSVSVLPRDTEKKGAYDYGLKRFLDEARVLARFNHPNIVRVLHFLEAHGTAYMIMDFEQGQPLSGHLRKLGEPMSEHAIMALARPLLDGLKVVHAEKFLHRDIKPPNIYLRAKGAPVLLDFGAARQAMGEHTGPLTAIVTPGYGPLEQYSSEGEQGPWTDLYALGGTLYRCMSGQTPTEATKRIAEFARGPDPLLAAAEVGKGRYSEAFLAAIDWMLALLPEDRPQSVADVLPLFSKEAPNVEATTRLRTELKERSLQTKTKLLTKLQEQRQRKTKAKREEQERQREAAAERKAEPKERRAPKGARVRMPFGWIALGGLLVIGAGIAITLLRQPTTQIDTDDASPAAESGGAATVTQAKPALKEDETVELRAEADAKAQLARRGAALLSSAREQLARGDSQGALRSIVSALEVDPTDAEARVLADEFLSNARSQVAKARQDAERARAPELAPTALVAARVKETEGESLSRSGEIENAVQTLWAGAQLFELARQQAELELARQGEEQARRQAEAERKRKEVEAQLAAAMAAEERDRQEQARQQAKQAAASQTVVAKTQPPPPTTIAKAAPATRPDKERELLRSIAGTWRGPGTTNSGYGYTSKWVIRENGSIDWSWVSTWDEKSGAFPPGTLRVNGDKLEIKNGNRLLWTITLHKDKKGRQILKGRHERGAEWRLKRKR